MNPWLSTAVTSWLRRPDGAATCSARYGYVVRDNERQNAFIEQHAREYLKKYGRFRFSVITRYEILRGLKAKGAVRQIAIFEDRCNRSYLYPVTNEIVNQASDIYAHLHQKGLLISDADILIASTAILHHLTLVTGNVDHFKRIPDLLCDSWKSL